MVEKIWVQHCFHKNTPLINVLLAKKILSLALEFSQASLNRKYK